MGFLPSEKPLGHFQSSLRDAGTSVPSPFTLLSMAFSLQARVVYPVDSTPIERGVVTTEGERIVCIGPGSDAGPPIDLGNVALMPAFVNAHTHLEFSDLHQPLGRPGMRLADWIRLVIAERGQRREETADAIQAGLRESIAEGVLALGEIVGASGSEEPYSLLLAPCSLLFFEVIGFSRARAASVLKSLEERLDVLLRSRAILAGISPHAPYTVSPALLKNLVSVARRRQLPVAMHLAESADELTLLASGTGPFQELLDERSMWDASAIPSGSRPLDYLRQLAEAPRCLVIHGNYLDAEEHAFLAGHADRMSLVFCPRTHAYFEYPPYPLAELLAADVRVALGTDSLASNPDLDLLAEMRHVAHSHPRVAPEAILRMGTLDGARALGCDAQTGSLTPGTRLGR
jgi:cytosine/adenosine deaminase-related metal-dependent hydrolase